MQEMFSSHGGHLTNAMYQIWCYSCHVNINNLPFSDMYFNTDRHFEMFKEAKLMDMILDKCIFQISVINFSHIWCWYTFEFPHRQFQSAPSTYVHSINTCFTIYRFSQTSQILFMFQCNEHARFCVFWRAPG